MPERRPGETKSIEKQTACDRIVYFSCVRGSHSSHKRNMHRFFRIPYYQSKICIFILIYMHCPLKKTTQYQSSAQRQNQQKIKSAKPSINKSKLRNTAHFTWVLTAFSVIPR